MRISTSTIEVLKELGIFVRWYPEETYEEFKERIWKECYNYAYDYSKDHVAGTEATNKGYANVLYQSFEELEEYSRRYADRAWQREADPYNFDTLYITHDNGQILVKKESGKSKAITADYVVALVEKDRKLYNGTYGRFAMAMQSICKSKGLTNKFCIYPTTYGIGVWLFYNFNAEKHIASVESIMREYGVEYYNEYSKARWVYRFKVSKKRENIELIAKRLADEGKQV